MDAARRRIVSFAVFGSGRRNQSGYKPLGKRRVERKEERNRGPAEACGGKERRVPPASSRRFVNWGKRDPAISCFTMLPSGSHSSATIGRQVSAWVYSAESFRRRTNSNFR